MNKETKEKFYQFADYLNQESEQICDELLDAYRANEMDCVYQFSGQFIQDYLTQYTNEIFKLTKENPMPAYACLVQRMMFLRAQYCLVTQMIKMLEELHPELEEKD